MTEQQEVTKPKILIVEDEAIIATELKALLQKLGYTVLAYAFSGKKALELIEQEPPDLVLMDIILKGRMDGIEAAEIIRSRWGIPVVFITAHADQGRLERAKLVYPFGYIIKPFDDNSIRVTIEMALYVSRVDAERRKAEDRLRILAVRHEAILAAVPDIVVEVDKDKVYKWANRAGLEFFGEDVVGREASYYFEGEQDTYGAVGPLFSGSEEVTYVESWQRRRDGEKRLLAWYCRVLKNAEGEVTGALSTARDITERKQVEEALREREEKYRNLFNNAEVGIFRSRLDGSEVLEVNRRFLDIVGMTLEETLGKPSVDLWADPKEREEMVKRLVADGSVSGFEYKMLNKRQGNVRSCLTSLRLYREEGILEGSILDVTERQQAEDATRLRSQEIAIIAEIGRVISSSMNIEEIYEKFAASAHKLIPFDRISISTINWENQTITIAYTAGKVIPGREMGATFSLAGSMAEDTLRNRRSLLFQGELLKKLFHNDPLQLAFQTGFHSALIVPMIFSDRVLGAILLSSVQSAPYEERHLRLAENIASQIAGTVVNAQLYAETKRAEEALQESEERYRSLVELSPDPIFLHSQGQYVYVNPAGIKLLGASRPEDIIGRSVFEIIHPDYQKEVKDRILLLDAGNVVPFSEQKYLRFDGTEVEVETAAVPVFHENQKMVQVMARDITERKQKEKEYKTILRTAMDGFWLTDMQGRFLDANESYCRLIGYSHAELMSMTIPEIEAIERPEETAERIKKIEEVGSDRFESRHRRKDGGFVDVEVSVNYSPIHNGRFFVFVRNITERKRADELLQRILTEKELLLKEVHHRIKNNMNNIISLLSLQSRTVEDPSALAALKDAQSRVRSMMVLYDKLYRSTGFDKMSVREYLSPLVDEIIGNFPNREMVKIEKNLEDFILDARILSPLGILINELLTNAMKSAFTDRENGVISVSASIRENHVAIVIQDNGIGIPETVDLKNSPGFGLQLVDMLTEQMGGRIRIERLNGTKFILEFEV